MKSQPAIKVSHVSKSFRLPHEKTTSIKSVIVHPFKRRSFEKQQVLKDINFEVKKGEFFGIVGRNGSGKSTLLKMLAGIYEPNEGKISVNGKLTPFIELGVGFNPELTGRENVFLNGALLGFSRKEVSAMYDEIVEFAELEKFMDQKLKNYSSGMQVRLAFSIAVRARTEIYLIDEVLAVGDANFQRKCMDFFETIRGKQTVIFVSHDMKAVERFCDRVLVLEKSKMVDIGKPEDMVFRYGSIMANADFVVSKKASNEKGVHLGTGDAVIKSVWMQHSKTGKKISASEPNNDLVFVIEFNAVKTLENPVFHLSIFSSQNERIYSVNTLGSTKLATGTLKGSNKVRLEIKNSPLAPGKYKVNMGIMSKDLISMYDHFRDALEFTVLGTSEIDTRIVLSSKWSFEKNAQKPKKK